MSHLGKSIFPLRICSHTTLRCTSFQWRWTRKYHYHASYRSTSCPKTRPCWGKCTFPHLVSCPPPIDHSTHSCQHTPIVRYHPWGWPWTLQCKHHHWSKCTFPDPVVDHWRKIPRKLIHWGRWQWPCQCSLLKSWWVHLLQERTGMVVIISFTLRTFEALFINHERYLSYKKMQFQKETSIDTQ